MAKSSVTLTLGPWNTVYRDGEPIAFIDFDGTHPETPIRDLAAAAWHFVPLGPDEVPLAQGFDEPHNYGERLRLFCDAYGLADRSGMLTALSEVKQRSAYLLRHWQPLRAGAGANWLRDVAASLDWLEDHTDALRQILR